MRTSIAALATVLLCGTFFHGVVSSAQGGEKEDMVKVKRSPVFHGTFTHRGQTLRYLLSHLQEEGSSSTTSESSRVKRDFFNKHRDNTNEVSTEDLFNSIEIRQTNDVSTEDKDNDEVMNAVGITASVVIAVKILAALISGVVFATQQ